MEQETKKATFAAGCFWGVEASFRELAGVLDTQVGYTGGETEYPTYDDVCSHKTGHAEAVEVTYDPTVTTYEQLLDAFFAMHDPTQKDGQGLNFGTNYRSAVFVHDDEQQQAVEAAIAKLTEEKAHEGRPIVTEISPVGTFWRAEEHHQRYFEKNGGRYC
jgi:peptide-methionine (S)-S-oxide reductase